MCASDAILLAKGGGGGRPPLKNVSGGTNVHFDGCVHACVGFMMQVNVYVVLITVCRCTT